MDTKKYIYSFGNGHGEGDRTMDNLLGGKGANLAEMSTIGMPVPSGFTISAEVCDYYNKHDGDWPDAVDDQLKENISQLEKRMDLRLGDNDDPLLVSVRSGAAISMPGMMDTVLNLGLNDQSVQGLANKTDNPRFAYDSYRRFIDMFGNVVKGVDHEQFEEAMQEVKKKKGVDLDTDLDAKGMKEDVDRFKRVYQEAVGEDFSQDPQEQLKLAINAVFGSWNTPRAITYRKINQITGLLGTAVNVQSMVYGNMGDESATGVCFTRNPADGTNELYGEFLPNAQGEDVVAGIRTPHDINELEEAMPESYEQLYQLTENLEEHYKDMQDIEFTIQEGKLYFLQTRDGKRTGKAAVKIAIDMASEGLISKEQAIKLVAPNHLNQLLHPQFKEDDEEDMIGKGLPASPGAAVGKVVFSSEKAEKMHDDGEAVILVRIETSPEDVGGMSSSKGILTSRGGMTSHAAVVARGWGKPCVTGCDDIDIDYSSGTFTNGATTMEEGDWISIDGTSGKVFKGKKPVKDPSFGENYHTLMSWIDEHQNMMVRTNADTPDDAQKARDFGATGIGLIRTEHMFFGEKRINSMRKMILSENKEERKQALEDLLPYQKEDFRNIFEAMESRPVTVRLLDPPLHEFLPDDDTELQSVSQSLDVSEEELQRKVKSLKEVNPMLGHRGCRLGISYPEITAVQTRAILEAAIELEEKDGSADPEIMIPLVSTIEEFVEQKKVVNNTAENIFNERGRTIDYKVGTMIETPRAALVAGEVAKEADFFSFGTNDLTQMTFGFSRDDAGKFLDTYLDEGIVENDPFKVLDHQGVGVLVTEALQKGREQNESLKVGICGEHGGDPSSVQFCYNLGFDYVSCSPYRVPIARLAVAQAQLAQDG